MLRSRLWPVQRDRLAWRPPIRAAPPEALRARSRPRWGRQALRVRSDPSPLHGSPREQARSWNTVHSAKRVEACGPLSVIPRGTHSLLFINDAQDEERALTSELDLSSRVLVRLAAPPLQPCERIHSRTSMRTQPSMFSDSRCASILFAVVYATHAGVPVLGQHPRVSRHGSMWGASSRPSGSLRAVLNIPAFGSAASRAGARRSMLTFLTQCDRFGWCWGAQRICPSVVDRRCSFQARLERPPKEALAPVLRGPR